jgi:hypothetical protein
MDSVPLTLPPGEPEAGPWRVVPLPEVAALVLAAAGRPAGRPAIVAVDGRSGSGKSTFAGRLHALVPRSGLVHTDDVAWNEPLFAWGDRLADDVLRPLRAGLPLDYRPPQWVRRGRDATITVPAGLDVVVVEGVGASQLEHRDLVDATVWVQADAGLAERRGIDRDVATGVNGDRVAATAFWHDWMRAETPFQDRQRPWRRACVVVNGTPTEPVPAGHAQIGFPS